MNWGDLTVKEFLEKAGSKESVPGGGAVSGISGALGASMGIMAARFTTGKRYAEVQDEIQRIVSQLEECMNELVELANEDSRAFGALSEAYSMPKGSDGKSEAIQLALKKAEKPPYQIALVSKKALGLLRQLFPIANKNLLSDVIVAAHVLRSAFKSALENIYVNLAFMKDHDFRRSRLEEMNMIERGAVEDYIAVTGEYTRMMNAKLKNISGSD